MSKGINKFIGIGNCCSEPEVRYMPNGGAVANFTIACDDGYKDKNTGQIIDKTEFIRIVMFKKLAEIAGEYLRKGSKVYIEGKLQTRKWQDQSGQDRYSTEIIANEMQMLSSNPSGQPSGNSGQFNQQQNNAGGFNQNRTQQNTQQQSRLQQSQQQPTYNEPPMDFDDGTIPF